VQRLVPVAVLATGGLVTSVAAPIVALAAPTAGATHTASAGRLYVGTTYRMKWGDVTVRIRVRGRRVVDVRGTLPRERSRSARINDHAGPILRREALRAQSARIHAVSGATMTSDSYVLSLKSALGRAHL
jgi:uncharacterized protein with FMN-binding domain